MWEINIDEDIPFAGSVLHTGVVHINFEANLPHSVFLSSLFRLRGRHPHLLCQNGCEGLFFPNIGLAMWDRSVAK